MISQWSKAIIDSFSIVNVQADAAEADPRRRPAGARAGRGVAFSRPTAARRSVLRVTPTLDFFRRQYSSALSLAAAYS